MQILNSWTEVTKIPVLCMAQPLRSEQHTAPWLYKARQHRPTNPTPHTQPQRQSPSAWEASTALLQDSWFQFTLVTPLGFGDAANSEPGASQPRSPSRASPSYVAFLIKGWSVMPSRRNTDCRVVKLAVGYRDRTGCQGQEGHETDLSIPLGSAHAAEGETTTGTRPYPSSSFSVLHTENHWTKRSSEKAIPPIWASLPGAEATKSAAGARERMDTQVLHLHTKPISIPATVCNTHSLG